MIMNLDTQEYVVGNSHRVNFVALVAVFFLGSVQTLRAATQGEVLAEIDGEVITAEDVVKPLGNKISQFEEQIYKLKREKIESIIADRLLAKEAARRGISVTALMDKEVTGKVGLVTEQEVEEFYQKNRARMRGEEATLRQQIRSYLQNQKLNAKREEFLRALSVKSKIVVHLQPPPVFRAEVSVDGAPFRGGADAPVTIVKFEDFECPFCKQAQPTLQELESKYKEKLKVVHRDFPLDQIHRLARQAAAAARCANEQGKFWSYHDKLYSKGPKLSQDDLKAAAQDVGLARAAFDQCVASGKYKAAVQKDFEEGTRLGVTGTPAFFINGRFVSGAQPLESFAKIIDDELARVK
jgi:protein-disulfide isomerase